MGVNDYGAATSPLDAPPLGGPGGWAESVAAVLNGSDETVDSRISVATADLGARITRPNVDDRLVEQWNGSVWSVVDYDSGWREVGSLLINGWTAAALRIRRKGITVSFLTVSLAGGAANDFATVPPGFDRLAGVTNRAPWATSGGAVETLTIGLNNYAATNTSGSRTGGAMYTTNDAIPTSLPGTLVTSAPE